MNQDVAVAWEIGAELGEGPIWSDTLRALVFVDIRRARLHVYHPEDGERRSWDLEEACCWLLPREGGGFVAGLRSGLSDSNSTSEGLASASA
ncbi:SMP-30/gluconolactonase/LRE family protein [Salinicola acroporae]|uniref:SMP-30/gluconolactonase/LRE family protein n=1 Tax=Salinicola acroporae TaxID=1541440 RepID=UPI002455529F|nr:SMP-30/gluconolactonase/LRE family protein [Salinicola acroporae]